MAGIDFEALRKEPVLDRKSGELPEKFYRRHLLDGVAAQWDNLAMELDISSDICNNISADFQPGVIGNVNRRCLRILLDYRQNGKPLRMLFEALISIRRGRDAERFVDLAKKELGMEEVAEPEVQEPEVQDNRTDEQKVGNLQTIQLDDDEDLL